MSINEFLGSNLNSLHSIKGLNQLIRINLVVILIEIGRILAMRKRNNLIFDTFDALIVNYWSHNWFHIKQILRNGRQAFRSHRTFNGTSL